MLGKHLIVDKAHGEGPICGCLSFIQPVHSVPDLHAARVSGSPGIEVISEKNIAWHLVGVEEEEVCGVLRVLQRLLHHLRVLKEA